MDMVLTFILLIAGFVLLVKGSDVFVDGSSSIAKLLGVPAIIVGLTIVSMGTSAPEAAVSISAGVAGSNEIALSNLVGSNTFNLLMVAGISAIITPFVIDRVVIKRDYPICLGIMITALLLAYFGNSVSRADGIILLVIFASYIGYLIYDALKNKKATEDTEEALTPLKSVLFIVIGLAAIITGGQLVVNSAVKIAGEFGMSENLIGVTIVAIGTSLPELVTSVVAAKKGQSDIAIGNVVGSNIFNLAFVLGFSTVCTPIAVVPDAFIDVCIMLGVNIIGYMFCITGRKFTRPEGIITVLIYVGYTVYLIMRQLGMV